MAVLHCVLPSDTLGHALLGYMVFDNLIVILAGLTLVVQHTNVHDRKRMKLVQPVKYALFTHVACRPRQSVQMICCSSVNRP